MTGQFTAMAIVVAVLAAIGWAMRAMWRQMRRVNAYTAERRREAEHAEPAPEAPGFEDYDPASGGFTGRDPEVNRELIRQGARATHSGSFLGP